MFVKWLWSTSCSFFSRGWERANPGAVTPAFNPPEPGFSLDSIYQSGLDWARSGFDCARLDCARTELDLSDDPYVGAIRVSEAWSQPSLRRLECPRSSQSFKH